ncbi:carbamoyltransferase C-terminal domain-containing protein [Thalassobaculum sp.]|uniref:carbamoyltransferase C-terminal domain-containing protein n=1 Tax=Thalassobaculum sp. TaxID=2022740 RepID=UPI0032EABE8F
MLIVGLQCGHDAAVSVIQDGRVVLHLERERSTRERHANSISAELIDDALRRCGVSAADIDYFALCTTQSMGYASTDGATLRFDYDWTTAEKLGAERFSAAGFKRIHEIIQTSVPRLPNSDDGPSLCLNMEIQTETPDVWRAPGGMSAIADLPADAIRPLFGTDRYEREYVLPMRVTYHGRPYPAVAVMHQLSHAAAAFYQSPFDAAPVFAHDNASIFHQDGGYRAGMVFYGEGRHLRPVWRASIVAGLLYSRMADLLGLGGMAGPGKLMGLSAYGTPEFFDPRFIGDALALQEIYDPEQLKHYRPDARWDGIRGWFAALHGQATKAGYTKIEDTFSDLGKQSAATVQKTFEELVAYTVARIGDLLDKAQISTTALCFSGGCALNCPTNTLTVETSRFTDLFIPPSCDDGGLSTGAALYVYHHMLGFERETVTPIDRNIAYLGREVSPGEIVSALEAEQDDLVIEDRVDTALRCAEDLAAGRIVALFDGRAESGPRALGHRSLLADPRPRRNWDRVNEVKRREWWRPFAPACLSERLRDHFDGGPEHSPHMLFNYQVTDKRLEAITHVDGSARVQTVGRETGKIRGVIEAFDRLTGLPVVLNTSLNGPGEPILDTPENALTFIRSSGADALYIGDYRVTPKPDRRG